MADITSRRANLSIEDFWRKTGLENISTFKEHYPEYSKKSGALSFLANMDIVHRDLTDKLEGAMLPHIFFKGQLEDSRSCRWVFFGSYTSMFSFFMPIVVGIISYLCHLFVPQNWLASTFTNQHSEPSYHIGRRSSYR